MSILTEIVKHKKEEVKRQSREVPISEYLLKLRSCDETKNFSRAISRGNSIAIIAEIKKASPSAGLIRQDFDHVKIAKIYEEKGASAISVLTEETYFLGKKEFLQDINSKAMLPLLRKDFIIDPYQIAEARVLGADAILLIEAILSKDQRQELLAAASEFGLQCLVEVHSIKEMENVLADGHDLIGINNRDLDTFQVDLATTKALAELVPAGVTLVSESGIADRSDVEFLAQFGIDAILVGESLMRTENPGDILQQLNGVSKCQR